MGRIIGIDFGTTNSLAAYITNQGDIKVIKDHSGDNLTPSVVCKYDNKLFVGKEARENIIAFNDGYGIKEIKREIGSGKKVSFAGEQMHPHEIAAIILKKIKRNAELLFGEEVNQVVITVPAEFSDIQRKEIIEAGIIAGFEVKKIINEPTAALMSYSFGKTHNKTILCYDFGGGTFDISVARINNQDISIIGVGGDRRLGGKDIDDTLLKYLRSDVERIRNCTLSKYGTYKLLLAIENMKIQLSTSQTATLSVADLATTDGRFVPYFKKMTRSEFENLIGHFINKSVELVEKALSENNLQSSQIDEVLLVGGTSKIPMVSQKLRVLFGQKMTFGAIDPQESVVLGAAIEAGNLSGIGFRAPRIIKDVCPFTLGLKVTKDGRSDVFSPIIRKNFEYGKEYSEKYHTILDWQNSMVLEIYQGESRIASQNERVCTFEVKGIPEALAKEEEVRIHFKYDMNGILNIKAVILSTGEKVTNSIRYGFDLSASVVSVQKVEELFISDDKIEEAIHLKKSLEKFGDVEEQKKIDNAIKFENEQELDKLMEDLLD